MRPYPLEPVRPDVIGPKPDHRADVRFERCPPRRRGFSLIELVVVIAIASVVAGMGILRYSNSLTHYRVDAACRRVVSELSRAQVEARTTGESRTIRFSTVKATMSVLSTSDISAGKAGSVVKLSDDPYRVVMDVNGLAGNSITFNRFGDPDGGGVITVRSGGASGAVTIEATSGRAYILGTE